MWTLSSSPEPAFPLAWEGRVRERFDAEGAGPQGRPENAMKSSETSSLAEPAEKQRVGQIRQE